MKAGSYRIEHDSMGELQVPKTALWGAQTQRAVENFPISGLTIPNHLIHALGHIKAAAAEVNADLGLLDNIRSKAIQNASQEVASGKHDNAFPVDVFQTGSGTSSNMNANEVIARLANKQSGKSCIHPNDHVNMGQSSNDVIPTAIQVSAAIAVKTSLLPSLKLLGSAIDKKARNLDSVIKTGRTHLMDAMPVTLAQELSAWSQMVSNAEEAIKTLQPQLQDLPLGGTAVGSGINTHPLFGKKSATSLTKRCKVRFTSSSNYFHGLSMPEAASRLSTEMKQLALCLMKISNDLRWMNSGPLAGLGEITLPTQQPGSSIMPGKVNPVTPEAVCMVAAQVIGNDATISTAAQSGNFQLNVMLPVIAYNLLQSIDISASACRVLANNAIKGFKVNRKHIESALQRNPILVTALNPIIGYEAAATIAKQAYAEERAIIDVAVENTDLTREELELLLDPAVLTQGGNNANK